MPFDLDVKPFDNRELSADDMVQTYLREIGQIPLLTDEEVILLSQKIEKEKHLQAIKQRWFCQYHRPLLATDIPKAILEKLAQANDFINLIQSKSGMISSNNLISIASIIDLIGELDNEAGKQIVSTTDSTTNEPESDNDACIINLIVAVSLLPKRVWTAISDIITLNQLENLATNENLDCLTKRYGYEIGTHVDNIKKEAKEARRKFTESNLRLVVSIARKYSGQDVPLLDIIQEGNIGLIKAIEKFDHRRGYKFSTYASWWIYQAITRTLVNQSRTIRIPVHTATSVKRILKTKQVLTGELGREPTYLELSQEMNISIFQLKEMSGMGQTLLSLDRRLGEEGDNQLIDFIEDHSVISPIEATSKELLKEDIRAILSTLTLREQTVINLRFGLDDGRRRTLEKVGQELRITGERVRQIETKAINRLRHPSRRRKLKDYY